MGRLLLTPVADGRPCPRCGARSRRLHVEQLPLWSDLFPAEGRDIDACTCGWTATVPETGEAA